MRALPAAVSVTPNFTKRTRGPWRVGKGGGSVVADVMTHERSTIDDLGYYGGFLISESSSPANAEAISLTGDLLDVLEHPGLRSVDLRLAQTPGEPPTWQYVVSIAITTQHVHTFASGSAVAALLLAAAYMRKAAC